ncbi:LegC family aminotransferase [Prochlorococcus marinus]|jgi:perosamine synthetase|uniref:Predicted pyridoxal phosphate-dependent enzyme n=1 Tax=Prochlorococcus marinus (strain MIT 9301) TaxID=167546 RepID=A3PE58_PROM0|nr:LegC family aminotransferase [Prochlorococcus marinus]ABO18033.1 Predicted pyridoxal phosphate-dependent enzyme [Prochlorococcus marinus str. MIT 9301]
MTNIIFCNEIVDAIENVVRKPNQSNDILLHEPYFKDNKALDYVKDCIDKAWVSTSGDWVTKFENKIKKITSSQNAIAITNGTVGLRLALSLVGVNKGDEVIMPPLTFIATANAIAHLNATPHFVDIEKDTLGLNPEILSKHLKNVAEKRNGVVFNKISGKKISAIIVVHVFGIPAKINQLIKVADEWDLPVIEDAAEALGSKVKGKDCGTFGTLGVYSFNGNKIVTTGGGGVIVTNDNILAKKAKHLSTTAKMEDDNGNIIHDQIAWNDRMPNINAALGFAQLEVFNERLKLKRLLAKNYIESFKSIKNINVLQEEKSSEFSNYWLVTLILDKDLNDISFIRNTIINLAKDRGIQLRPCWQLIHKTEMYNKCFRSNLDISESLSKLIISLPSSPQIVI